MRKIVGSQTSLTQENLGIDIYCTFILLKFVTAHNLPQGPEQIATVEVPQLFR
jgi:hypothetical protein